MAIRDVRQLVKQALSSRFNVDVLWNFGSLGILATSGLVINGIIVTSYNISVLGVFNQIFAFYIVLSQFAVGGVHLSVLQKVSYAPDNIEATADILISALLLVIMLSVPLVIVIVNLADGIGNLLDSSAIAPGIIVMAPGLMFFSLNKVLISLTNGLQQMRVYAIFQALRYILIMAFIVGIIIAEISPIYLPLALTLAEVSLFVIITGHVFGRVLPFRVRQQMLPYVAQHLSFGIRGLGSGVLIEFNTRVDVLMLGFYLGDSVVGIYSFATTLIEGFAQLPVIMRFNIDPLLGKHFASNQPEQIEVLSAQIRRYFVPIMFVFGVVGTAIYPILYIFLTNTSDFQSSWFVFIILASSVILASMYTPFRGILLQASRPGLFTLMIILLVLNNIILNALLIPLIGLYGAAFATGLTNLLEAFLLFQLPRRYLGIRL